MSDEKGQKDPSMEEILGSIRKIITEDNTEGAPNAQPAAGDDEEVLDLTEEVPAESGDEPVALVLDSPVVDSPVVDSPVVDSSAVEVEPEPEEPRREPVFGSRPPDEAEPAAPPEAVASEPREEEGIVMAETTELPESAQPAPTGKLVSEEATSATAASLGELSKAVAGQSGAKLGVGDGNTVEDMVKEMMRPMLREWLDDNLPGIVERLVRREIQNLVDRSRDDD